ncbi:MAG TPA: glycosyltransferase family 2 protein [Candidatus Limnocylindrales bacterium]|nr:glycosyltransferase family 2 protein [Candidatus Limnocylindrales bacterium]
MKTKRIAIIIPAYNEASVIGSVIAALPHQRGMADIDVVVVNDGSSDDTAAIAQQAGCKVISHPTNFGCGAAITTGLEYARQQNYDYAVTMDADGQHKPDDCVAIIDAIMQGNHDFILGSRLVDPAGMPWYRVVGNKGFNLITWLLFHVKVTDSQSGLRAFSKQALRVVQLRSTGMEFSTEILWQINRAGLRIGEVPIEAIYTEYSLAKGQKNSNAYNILVKLVQYRVGSLMDA